MDGWIVFLCSAGGVAFLEGVFRLIQHILDRRAEKKDGKSRNLADRIAKIEEDIGKLEENNQAEIAGLRSLLCIEIKSRAKAALAIGYISAEDLEDLTREHDLYHNELGGNGFLSSLMARVNKLPVKD